MNKDIRVVAKPEPHFQQGGGSMARDILQDIW